jgi:DNA-binding MarR family transcriptional regulator
MDDAKARKVILLAAYHKSQGDLSAGLNVKEFADALRIEAENAIKIITQLSEKGLLRFGFRTLDPTFNKWQFHITMKGIEDIERLNQPLLVRWRDGHPALFTIAQSIFIAVVTGLVIKFLGKILDL